MFELPIDSKRSDIVQAVRDNQVVIVIGETGSGKTTRIPQFLFQEDFASSGKIGITEPRRIAAISTAQYVAGELNVTLGDVVGYQVRFDDQTKGGTCIKFMTDGILLQEMKGNPLLLGYSVIMIDEAHERSVNIDFLLGLLKRLLPKRPDLKVVIASATIDAEKFSRYFRSAPIINVSGRLFSVNEEYRHDYTGGFKWMLPDLVKEIKKIHLETSKGDVLVFVTGKDEIDQLALALETNMDFQTIVKNSGYGIVILPVHGEMPPEDQRRIFDDYPDQRKIIIATNVAETSITPGAIKFVIDTGFIKQSNFSPSTGIRSLDVVEHSQAGCNQRMGRAGRVADGTCIRMYSYDSFAKRPLFTKPEILRISLTDVVLQMKNLGIEHVETFQFIDPPDPIAFHEAYETLVALGAIRKGVPGLTEIGQAMADLPLDARTARMVLEADRHGCVKEVATIAAFLQVRNVFSRPREKSWEADRAHDRFKDPSSDVLGFLKIWDEYLVADFDRNWCFEHFLSAKALQEVRQIRSQLFEILNRRGFKISESGDKKLIRKAVVMGLAYNLFEHSSRGVYASVAPETSKYVRIHPSSGLFMNDPRFMVVAEILQTTKVWGRIGTEVEPEWLPELLPNLFTLSDKFVSSVDGEGTAVLVQYILDRRYQHSAAPAGKILTVVSEEEAFQVQVQSLEKARRERLIMLTFRRYELYTYLWTGYDRLGQSYQAYGAEFEGDDEQVWMCRGFSHDEGFDSKTVTPVFRLFDFSTTSHARAAVR